MSDPIIAPDPFATAMQQLSAEAKKTVAAAPRSAADTQVTAGGMTAAIETRFQELEANLFSKIDQLVGTLGSRRDAAMASQFRKMDEHLTAIRNSESVNQRLFDSLHDELLKYRDNFVHESLQKPFIHDLVHLFDDLSALASQLGSNAQEQKKRGHVAQWRDNLENAIHSLMEILHRFGVKEIESHEKVDRALHKVVSFEPTDFPEEDGRIMMRLKRGFVWRDTLIRPEEVIAKRYG